ncbi:MAG: 50S ribosomal protein L24 [Patescibacteria group bacterium]
MHIKKGDHVHIVLGKDRGKEGKVLHVFPEKNRVSIEGVNLFKKRSRPKKQGEKGETVLLPRSIHVSNMLLVCKNCKKPARMSLKKEGGKKSRYCKKCEALND